MFEMSAAVAKSIYLEVYQPCNVDSRAVNPDQATLIMTILHQQDLIGTTSTHSSSLRSPVRKSRVILPQTLVKISKKPSSCISGGKVYNNSNLSADAPQHVKEFQKSIKGWCEGAIQGSPADEESTAQFSFAFPRFEGEGNVRFLIICLRKGRQFGRGKVKSLCMRRR
jgi:hypothetical protein